MLHATKSTEAAREETQFAGVSPFSPSRLEWRPERKAKPSRLREPPLLRQRLCRTGSKVVANLHRHLSQRLRSKRPQARKRMGQVRLSKRPLDLRHCFHLAPRHLKICLMRGYRSYSKIGTKQSTIHDLSNRTQTKTTTRTSTRKITRSTLIFRAAVSKMMSNNHGHARLSCLDRIRKIEALTMS